jgi:hypothetical protein
MKITIEVPERLFNALVTYSQLTTTSVNKQIDEALEDYVACVIPARVENLIKSGDGLVYIN